MSALTDDEIKAGGRWTSSEAEEAYRALEGMMRDLAGTYAPEYRLRLERGDMKAASEVERSFYSSPHREHLIQQMVNIKAIYWTPVIQISRPVSPRRA